MAGRNKLKVIDEIGFCSHDWPGYELRRHHVGKSFQNRVNNCIHYTLINDDDDSNDGQQQQNMFNLFRLPKLKKENKTTDSNSNNDNNSNKNYHGNDNDNNEKKNKRKLKELSHDFTYNKIESNNNNDNTITIKWRCNECSRDFTSEQGVKTHINQVHILEITGPAKNIGIEYLYCNQCNKIFSNENALFQHTKSKHESLKESDNRNNNSSNDENATNNDNNNSNNDNTNANNTNVTQTVECMVCGLKFLTNGELELHNQQYKPIDVDNQLQCPQCDKTCRDQRGLDQHITFCH
jgi:uncharacterized C2H2 Zn-finger protein